MARTVVVKLTDDLDGSDADETVQFAIDGKAYEIDLSAANAAGCRDVLKTCIENGRVAGGAQGHRTPRTAVRSSQQDTLYCKLSADEKARFRAWANMATARRISDARVKSWEAAGKP